MLQSVIFILALFIVGCASNPEIRTVHLTDADNTEVRIEPSQNAISVIYFLSPECPLCINYTLAIRTLEQKFASDSIKFYGVYSKEWFTPKEVKKFSVKYKLDFEMLFDDENQLARVLGATVTPEVFVLNSDSEILYSGKIDNWVSDLGKKKLEVSKYYLENALTAWRDGKAIEPNRTEPVGCLIE